MKQERFKPVAGMDLSSVATLFTTLQTEHNKNYSTRNRDEKVKEEELQKVSKHKLAMLENFVKNAAKPEGAIIPDDSITVMMDRLKKKKSLNDNDLTINDTSLQAQKPAMVQELHRAFEATCKHLTSEESTIVLDMLNKKIVELTPKHREARVKIHNFAKQGNESSFKTMFKKHVTRMIELENYQNFVIGLLWNSKPSKKDEPPSSSKGGYEWIG